MESFASLYRRYCRHGLILYLSHKKGARKEKKTFKHKEQLLSGYLLKGIEAPLVPQFYKVLYKFVFLHFMRGFLFGLHCSGGRNFLGRICVYHQGAGNKRRFRHLDRFRRLNQYGYILKIFKDKFWSPFVGFVVYLNGLCSLLALAHGVLTGSCIFSGDAFPAKVDSSLVRRFSLLGSSNILDNFNLFTVVSSLELFPWSGFKLVKAAGSSAFIVGKPKGAGKVIVKLSSGWQLRIPADSMAVYGSNSNRFYIFSNLRKAGKSRAFGIRPTVRGVIKNPCDHPHGGGEGRGSPPAAAVTPWGFFTKGTPTKNRKFDRKKRRQFKLL